ncbi:hypothetical protein Gogos_009477 [Gossypium gossypioides]|uniref:Dynein light chain n=1 Tax=Gossypium gossypioides TaxID=34282 RepID=A0A7J9CEX4_GOSGO|nr:hypothetical protein [Gossypium gossypioides]
MLEGKAVIGDTDMLQTMQQDALHLAAKSLDFFDVTEATDIARFVKKEFDKTYGEGWQCMVGTDFERKSPPLRYIKLNTDRARSSNSRLASTAVVARDDVGRWLGVSHPENRPR